ncbi:MAG TPA: chaperone modulator CbpM [Candidatus Binatia bacterium]|jgi:DNA-binding transcriptional MerR regulator
MPENYLRITEVVEICCVDEAFVLRLEQENLITPVVQDSEKLYPLEQVDRIRVAHLLMEDMGVNLEGAEVALHMRDQMIEMQRQFSEVLKRLSEELKK